MNPRGAPRRARGNVSVGRLCRPMLGRATSLSKNASRLFCKISTRTLDEKTRPGEVEPGVEGDSVREIREPRKCAHGVGSLAHTAEATYNPLCSPVSSATNHRQDRDSGRASMGGNPGVAVPDSVAARGAPRARGAVRGPGGGRRHRAPVLGPRCRRPLPS